MTLEDATRVAILRGRLMQRVAGQGKTAAVGLGVADVQRRLSGTGDLIAVAAINGPQSTTISGPGAAVDRIVAQLAAEGIFARVLPVDCAFHGPQMDPLRGEFVAGLRDIVHAPAAIPMVSTVTGAVVAGPILDAEYWGRNLREPVRFSAAVATLGKAGHEVFVELGPHPVLGTSIANTLQDRPRTVTIVPSLRRGDDSRGGMLKSLGTLYAAGVDPNWDQVNPPGRFVPLPSYPWQRTRFWPDVLPAHQNGHSHANGTNGHASKNGTNGHADGRFAVPALAAPANGSVPTGLLYDLSWQAEDVAGNNRATLLAEQELRANRWLIVGRGAGLAGRLEERLLAAGADCERREDDDLAWLHAPGSAPWKVVDLRAIESDASAGFAVPTGPHGHLDGETTLTLEDVVAENCERVAALIRALPEKGRARLYVVTREAQPVLDSDEPALAQAPLWGLGKCAALEHPESWGGLIDLGPDASDDEVDQLLGRMVQSDAEDQYALRHGRWFVPRLRSAQRAVETTSSIKVWPEGTYLITGGLGDLGLMLARWLVDRGARRLVLLGRRGLPHRLTWDALTPDDPARAKVGAVRALEEEGATVLTVAVDASDRVQMSDLFDQLSQMFPPIRGIVHAAGVVTPRALRELSHDDFLATLHPKVAGTQVLDELTRALSLDFFVLFSSVSSVWGSARLADYAAANAFLDAFAHRRRALGLPALSVNWGPWAEVGMAASPDWGRSLALMGLKALKADHAFEALDRLAAGPARQVTVADVDWHTFKVLHGQHGRRHFLDLVQAGPNVPAHTSAVKREWLDLPTEAQREKLAGFLRDRVARVLGHDPGRVDTERPLTAMGLDSLMAMELRGAIESELGTVVPLTSFLEGPS
ncbi:MAG: SDR family NAD(P)-dependent oxidoreductase, partial [Isosphaeraceae bacterium]|nr:SDR family NAD(P)-dependent oxidoreductase [Isosphaeraceae bacterium]